MIRGVHRAVVLLFAVAIVQGCTTSPQLRAESDPDVDFSRFKTYRFIRVPSALVLGHTGPVSESLIASIQKEMETRGYVFDPNDADLLVNFSVRLKKSPHHKLAEPRNYYDYRGGHYDIWPAYTWEADEDSKTYVEGTINVDLVARARRRLVWEGIAIGGLPPRHTKDIGREIGKEVKQIFELYPYRAGRLPGET